MTKDEERDFADSIKFTLILSALVIGLSIIALTVAGIGS